MGDAREAQRVHDLIVIGAGKSTIGSNSEADVYEAGTV